MPQDPKTIARWKDRVTRKHGCDRTYIDKIVRDVRRNNDPTLLEEE